MRTPKKPGEAPVAPLLTQVVSTAPARDLTLDEMLVLEAFRAMDDRAKRDAVIRMNRIANTHPGRPTPRLCLVHASST